MTPRVIAIDWSGAREGAGRKIWLAEASDHGIARLECGRGRRAVADHLIAEARRTPDMVVGFDFAFSLPAWFLIERALRSAPELWDLVAEEGERWLAECAPPFWGRSGKRCPELPGHFRRTDRAVPAVGGIRPKSVFQVGGAGAVGTGSLRGMPILKRLREAGFSVWPFDPPTPPLVVEIYPRALTGAVNKGDPVARDAYLRRHHPSLGDEVRTRAASSEDAFDAAVSALVMARHRSELTALPPATDDLERREGRIWWPAERPIVGAPRLPLPGVEPAPPSGPGRESLPGQRASPRLATHRGAARTFGVHPAGTPAEPYPAA